MDLNNDNQEISLREEEVIEEENVPSPSKQQKKGGRVIGGGPSAVWNHFSKIVGMNKCKYCPYSTAVKRPGNLVAHLQAKHKEAYENYSATTSAKTIPKSISKISSSSAGASSSRPSVPSIPLATQSKLHQFVGGKSIKYYDHDNNRYKDLMNALTILFASNSLPYLLVESPELVSFIKLLDPKFKLPSRRQIATEIGKLHEKLKAILEIEIKKAKKVCLILDIWSQRGLSESYLGVLIRYFDQQSLSMKQALIALSKMEGSHTGENIKEMLQSICLKWDIKEEKISYYVTDSGSNVVKALKECIIVFAPTIEDEEDEKNYEEADPNIETEEDEDRMVDQDLDQFDALEKEHFETFGYEKRIPCVAHKLMCVVRKGIDGSTMLNPIIKSAIKLVKTFTQSHLNKELLLKYNNNRGLLAPSQTRWVYTYYVLNRLLESKEAVEKVIKEKKLNTVALNPLQWEKIENIRDLLRLFTDTVNELEGDKYPTINQVIPAIKDLLYNLEDKLEEEPYGRTEIDNVRRELKKEIEDKFAFILDQRQPNFQPAHMIATFFDLEFVMGLNVEERDFCIRVIIRDILSSLPRPTRMEAGNSSKKAATTAKSSKFKGFFKNMQEASQQPDEYDQSKMLQIKLEAYIEEIRNSQKILPDASDQNTNMPIDSITFWVAKLATFGEIANYALNILMVPASSAGIERVFSLASIVQGGRRYRLSASNTEKELMIKVNRDFLM